MFDWSRKRRRERLLAEPLPPAWRTLLDRMPAYRALSADERTRLEGIARVIEAEKAFAGAGGLELRPEMRITIAAQAARLVLGVEHDHFADVVEIVVYPTTFARSYVGPLGIETDRLPADGEAWYRGPVVLAWDAVERAAYQSEPPNAVLHEFAHRLDMLDGVVNGTPPLHARKDYRPWKEVMTAEFERLRAIESRDGYSLLDLYGAQNPGEFFAVATECFFGDGAALEREHPEMYALFRDYYRQDPARRAGTRSPA